MYVSSLVSLLFGGILASAVAVIVWGKSGRQEVWPKADWDRYTAIGSGAFILTAATPLNDSSLTSNTTSSPSKKSKRDCDGKTVIWENPTEYFVNWDVPMSSVVSADGITSSVSVSQGYSVANSVSVTSNTQVTLVKDFLQSSLLIAYARIWTTSYNAAYTYSIQPGKKGVIVSNPYTRRESGHVYSGCIGDPTGNDYYQADSYNSQSYGGMDWIEGVIHLCTGDAYPLPMCTGSGLIY
ncbi:hypothetical protein BJ875DRAFT_525668 [Amylocarpus encephaloides]|uniref:Uncharacterized protein n=1 Tax=Amylocarpus encephaloides TaxID=45428 RepID=A0A9P8C0C1_9HELO|nr:hypothetical protein BJ875DRAFT_525668 [Amylocarpus encephaloides]